MTYARLNEKTYLIRLEKGEEIITELQNFAKLQQIYNGKIEGIGSIENPTLAHYRMDNKKYSEKELNGVFEVTSLLGNISIAENKSMIHAHVTIGNEQMEIFGGHLVKGNVSATLELIITAYPTKYQKELDENIGLKLWKLDQKI